MRKNFRLLLILFIGLAIHTKTAAHNNPAAAGKNERAKTSHAADLIYSETYLNNTFASAIYFQRGMYRLEMNEYEAAMSDFNKAIDLYPFDAEAYLQRAYTKKLLGQKEGAIEDYQLAAYLNPTYKDVVF